MIGVHALLLRGSGYLGYVDSNQGYNPYKWVICPLTRVINLHITSYLPYPEPLNSYTAYEQRVKNRPKRPFKGNTNFSRVILQLVVGRGKELFFGSPHK